MSVETTFQMTKIFIIIGVNNENNLQIPNKIFVQKHINRPKKDIDYFICAYLIILSQIGFVAVTPYTCIRKVPLSNLGQVTGQLRRVST